MNRNITIVSVILVLAVISGYLVWSRGKVTENKIIIPKVQDLGEEIEAAPTTDSAKISTSEAEEASPTSKQTSTPSATRSATPTR